MTRAARKKGEIGVAHRVWSAIGEWIIGSGVRQLESVSVWRDDTLRERGRPAEALSRKDSSGSEGEGATVVEQVP